MNRKSWAPPEGVVNDEQSTAFPNRMMELHKRFKDGGVSPHFTLQGIQNLIEGKYEFETQFGLLKLFGPSVEVWDKCTPYGYGPETFFKENLINFAEFDHEGEKQKLFSLFVFAAGVHPDTTHLAPYCVPKGATVGEILSAVDNAGLYPSITLGHIRNLAARNAAEMVSKGTLFEGKSGNYFLIRDNQGTSWFIWVWLHSAASGWCYKFLNTKDNIDQPLYPNARIWLLSK